MALHPRARVLLIAGAIFLPLGALVWFLSARYATKPVIPMQPAEAVLPSTSLPEAVVSPEPSTTDAAPEPSATPPDDAPATGFSPTPADAATPALSPSPPPAASPPPEGEALLLVPVAGVRPEELRDTYNDARSEGRSHNAIDISAARGTPVVAAADGRIVKLFLSVPGGITIYQLSADQKLIYYYAHLERYTDGLAEKQPVRRGQVIAYVGDTGNAGAGNYHLHFSVSVVADPKRYWEGTNVNPYPLLRK